MTMRINIHPQGQVSSFTRNTEATIRKYYYHAGNSDLKEGNAAFAAYVQTGKFLKGRKTRVSETTLSKPKVCTFTHFIHLPIHPLHLLYIPTESQLEFEENARGGVAQPHAFLLPIHFSAVSQSFPIIVLRIS